MTAVGPAVLYHEVVGPPEGEVVVLSSGLGGVGAFWRPQLAALSARFRVVLYDQRGTGRSGGAVPDPYTIEEMAADVVGVLDALGVARCHFVGHALGGLIGLSLALAAPERVARLAVVNGWGKTDGQTLRCFAVRRALLEHAGVEAYVRAQPLFLYPAPWMSAHEALLEAELAHGVAQFQGAETLLRRIGALSRFDVTDRLGEVGCPVLVAASRDDLLVPWTASERLAAGLRDGRLWVVPEGGHAFTVTEAAAFNAGLLEFLAGH